MKSKTKTVFQPNLDSNKSLDSIITIKLNIPESQVPCHKMKLVNNTDRLKNSVNISILKDPNNKPIESDQLNFLMGAFNRGERELLNFLFI